MKRRGEKEGLVQQVNKITAYNRYYMSGSNKPEMNMALYKDQIDADKEYIDRECRKTLVVYGKEYVEPARCDAAKLYVKEKETYRRSIS